MEFQRLQTTLTSPSSWTKANIQAIIPAGRIEKGKMMRSESSIDWVSARTSSWTTGSSDDDAKVCLSRSSVTARLEGSI